MRSERGKKFSYRDIKKVYTIVFFEKSTKEFHKMKHEYIHRMKQHSDTGIKVELLQEYIDRNTVDYMMDEMQEELDALKGMKEALEEEKTALENTNAQLEKEAERKDNLFKLLADAERFEDIRKALADETYLEKLYQEFRI